MAANASAAGFAAEGGLAGVSDFTAATALAAGSGFAKLGGMASVFTPSGGGNGLATATELVGTAGRVAAAEVCGGSIGRASSGAEIAARRFAF